MIREESARRASPIPIDSKALGFLVAAAGILAGGCQSKGSPVNLGSLELSLVDGGATATQPNPCEIDIDFGNDAVGKQVMAVLRVSNTGITSETLTVSAANLGASFAADLANLMAPLEPASFVDVGLTFDPTGPGLMSSTFSIGASPAATSCASLEVSLAGTGVATGLAVDPPTLDLGNALLGTSVQKSVTLTNQASNPVSGLTASVTGFEAADFTLSAVPSSLDAGSSVEITVTFQPKSQVSQSSATATFTGSAGQSAMLSLSGEPLSTALTLAPSAIDFGYVVPASLEVACATATNISNVQVTITGLGSFTTAQGAFAASAVDDASPPNSAPIPVTIVPDAGAEVCFTFTPSVPNQYTGQVTLLTSPTEMNPVLQLTGFGGGPEVSCTPPSLAFGQAVDGINPILSVTCTNTGTAYVGSGTPSVSLVLAPAIASPAFSAAFDLVTNPYPPDGLPPGQSAQIDVTYLASGTSNDTGALSIATNAGRGQSVEIPLSGQSLNVPPCQFAILPASLDFGNIAFDGGAESDLSFSVENLGSDICLVKDLVLVDPTGSFRIVSTNPQVDPTTGWITIPAGFGAVSALQVEVAFLPGDIGDAGAAIGQVDFWISSPTETEQSVALRGTSGSPCLVYVPAAIDFGSVGTNDAGAPCESAKATISVFNQCGTDATLQSIALQSGSGDTVPQFSVPAPSGTALGSSDPPQTYTVTFLPTSLGTHVAQLAFSEGAVDTLVRLSGTAVETPTQTDSFVTGPPKVDFLFVRDIGDDVYSEPLVAGAMTAFLDAGADVDYRLAVTTNDDPRENEPNYGGWLLPCPSCFAVGPDPIVVWPSSALDAGDAPDPAAVFDNLLGDYGTGDLDTGTNKDKRLQSALYEALARDPRLGLDFFRPGAYFAVINESGDNDADQSGVLHTEAWYESFFAAWFVDPALFSWSYINPTQTVTGTGLASPLDLPPAMETLIAATNGLALNTEDSNWAQAFLSLWPAVVSANLRYYLSSTPPAGANGMTVTINGTAAPAAGWAYNGSVNAVIFAAGSAPQNGDQVKVTYPIWCP